MPKIHPDTPHADGKLFDVTHALQAADTSELVYAGMIFTTEFKAAGKTYGGTVVARDQAQAETIAAARGLGERITGQMEESGYVD